MSRHVSRRDLSAGSASPWPVAPSRSASPAASGRFLPPVSAIPLVWQPAHYDWTGAAYQYVAGRHIKAAGHTHWAAGCWMLDGARRVRVPAHCAG